MSNNGNGESSNTNGNKPSENKRPTRDLLTELTNKRLKNSNVRFPSMSTSVAGRDVPGPIYPITGKNDQFVLYEPKADEIWHSEERPDGLVPVVLHPELLNGKPNVKKQLMTAQIEGLKFIWNSFWEGKGCILAHEMGLGKTRTIITLIATLLEQSLWSKGRSTPGLKKCIILGPKNAVPVWEHEIRTWCPASINIKPETISSDRKDEINRKIVLDFVKPDSTYNILISSYESFKKYSSTFKDYPLNSIDLLVCDEAHVLKNNRAQRTKTVQEFKAARIRIGVTGTPYQNNLEEFCNLINLFRPQVFQDTEDYKRDYCKPITNFLKKNPKLDLEKDELMVKLKSMILPTLQYKSSNIKVEKHEIIICAPLKGPLEDDGSFEIQNQMYERLTDEFSVKEPIKTIKFYNKIDYLTKACIHPSYLYKTLENKAPAALSDLIDLYKTRIVDHPKINESPERFLLSGKIAVLLEMVTSIKKTYPSDKVVIVSNSKEGTLQIIKDTFKSLNYDYTEYDGDMGSAARELSMQTFEENDECRFFLLSLKAGSTALTLTRANHMILMDPDWNPATDKQALARVYRPGQMKNVYLYRLLATGTIEETKFINQLGKEEFDKYFKHTPDQPEVQIQDPILERDLLKYYPTTNSRLKDVLQLLDQVNEEAEDDYRYRAFADEWANSTQYTDLSQVPETLPVLRGAWPDLISYAFHKFQKAIDNVDTLLAEVAMN